MSQRIVIVVTNISDLGNTGKKTGWYLPEVAHPYHVFRENGFIVDFASPLGGAAPVDPGSVENFKNDEICAAFLADEAVMNTISTSTLRVQDLDVADYAGVYFAGGHGPMFDMPGNVPVAEFTARMYEAGKAVGAVCHGPVGLVDVRLSNGDPLVKGKNVTSFTNAEEAVIGLTEAMPFALETRLGDLGGNFSCAPEKWAAHVAFTDRLVTGQNPASATPSAEKFVEIIKGQ